MVIGSIPTGLATVVKRCFTQIGAGGGFSERSFLASVRGSFAFLSPPVAAEIQQIDQAKIIFRIRDQIPLENQVKASQTNAE